MAKKNLSPNSRKDEKDIVPFIRAYAERPAMVIVNKFAAAHELLQGTELQFRNNAYGLHPKLVQGDGKSLPPPNKKRSPDRSTSLAPGRWAVRIAQKTNIETTALVGEYKAAHKLPGASYHQVLGSGPLPKTFFEDCAWQVEAEPEAGRLSTESTKVAKVLCRAYHYMIVTGLEYGYAASGECMVFLTIPFNTPDVMLIHQVPYTSPVPPQFFGVNGLVLFCLGRL
ncbi:hypothetical protein B0T26DRAFT_155292 [Lasiosphaeria miniovina]|uniref:Uncharacterized protein n=1 Tax=Lasiosphaeria miniovina TaxID=1954250 RepID=A0AA40B5R7_9PEZI|nr:uncharacterized protein B0T26DRAFT_155292 [Lasiosphaeria miniovina]KAK0728027.1 hypothetical protein B0T26DRAFT_155292 [Lasiosphaeria miniovina]